MNIEAKIYEVSNHSSSVQMDTQAPGNFLSNCPTIVRSPLCFVFQSKKAKEIGKKSRSG